MLISVSGMCWMCRRCVGCVGCNPRRVVFCVNFLYLKTYRDIMSRPTDIITPESMIEWLKDGMADREEIEDQLHLMESHGILSPEDVQTYMQRIAEVMDAPVPLTLPHPSMYYPLDPQVTPT